MHYIKRKAQTARSQKVRKWLSVLLICLGIAPLCCGCAYLFDYYTGPDTSLKNYLKHGEDGWLHDEPYELFPSLEAVQSAEEQHYLYKKYTSPTFLLDDDILTYLSCTYTEEDYNTEIERMQNLCGGLDEQTFLVPAYVLFRNFPNGFSEYAIADADSHTVFYIAVQGTMLFEKYVPESLHPVSIGSTEKQAPHNPPYGCMLVHNRVPKLP